MLWATNWPHPGHEDPAIRDEAHLLECPSKNSPAAAS
jgi:hypothetical protein